MILPVLEDAVVTDVDQVLLDYASRLREFVNNRDGKTILGHSHNWNLTEWLQLKDEDEMLDTLHQFAKSHQFGTLDVFPGSDTVLHSLLREGYKIICLTACGSSEITTALRMVNLINHFGDIFEEVHFVEFSDSKSDKLKDIASRYNVVAFIDDKPANLEDAISGAGIKNTILMKSPHNRDFRAENPDVLSAFSWYECKHFINEFSKKEV